MLGNDHFYNRTIRKVVVAFGTMFNDIMLVRYTKDMAAAKERFKVPLSYGAKEKYLTRITADPTLTKSINTVVPRISFEMTSMSYDVTRKQVSTIRNFAPGTSITSAKTQFAPIPYNFDFSMSIYVRNTEDGTQILEQILPFFTPDFTVTVDFIPSMEQKYDMPIILNSVTNEVDYEGDMMSTRLIIWNLEFTAKGYIWPPVKSGEIIRQANTNIYYDAQNRTSQKLGYWANSGTLYYQTGEIVRVPDRGVIGTVSYFSNDNTSIVIVDDLNKLIEVGDKLVGDKTNASYIIKSTDLAATKTIAVVTTSSPTNAEPDDEFGFAETITTWPDTL